MRVLTLGEDEKLISYAKSIVDELRGNFVRCEPDFRNDPIKAKIAEAEQAKVPYDARHRRAATWTPARFPSACMAKGNVGAKPKGEVVADILASIKERRA